MGLKKEELDTLVPLIIQGDNNAFEMFSKEYSSIIVLHAKKWVYRLERLSFGMYTLEDVIQEIWWFVLRYLPKFDSSRSTMTTWLYMIANHWPQRLARSMSSTYAHPTGGDTEDENSFMAALDYEFSNEDGNETSLLSFISDPRDSIENNIVNEYDIYLYIYLLKGFISQLDTRQRQVYMHTILGITQSESAKLLGISQVQISRIIKNIYRKIMSERSKIDNINQSKAIQFSLDLLSSASDEQLSETLNLDYSTIKICREILHFVGLYAKTEAILYQEVLRHNKKRVI